MSTNSSSRKLTRREFIRLAAGFSGAALLASCAPAPAPATTAPTSAPAAAATAVPAATKAAVATSAPAATTAPVAKAPVEITWWRSLAGTNGTELEAMVKDFNASQSAIIVKQEYQGVYADLRDKLTAAAAAGASAMPDVVLLADTMYRNFAVNKRLEPLDDLIMGPTALTLPITTAWSNAAN
jgi:ABC-type glycerol-3-phosphate transport system substrate-binding protein